MPDEGIEKGPDKEGMHRAIATLLSRGYAVSNPEVSSLAEAYGVKPTTAPGTIETRAAQEIMREAGVRPIRKDHYGSKIWVDGNGKTMPGEIRKTERIIDSRRRKGEPIPRFRD